MSWVELIEWGLTLGGLLQGIEAGANLARLALGGTRIAVRLSANQVTGCWVAGDENETLLDTTEREITDIPVLIQATPRRAFKDAEAYLADVQRREQQKVFAPLYVIGTGEDPTRGKWLDMGNDDEWHSFVREFYEFIEDIQRIYGSKRYHLFMAAPSALCFGLGAAMGCQRKVFVYQYDSDAEVIKHRYMNILTVSNRMLNG